MLLALILIIIAIVLVYQAIQISKIPKPTREQYKAIIKSCNLRKIGAGISVDDNKQILVLPGTPNIPIPLSDVINIETDEKTRQITTTTGSIKKKGALTRGALGMAMLGPAGGVVVQCPLRRLITENIQPKLSQINLLQSTPRILTAHCYA